ncbi:MAG: glucose 1-dehydrogenase [Pseudomonadota bacterium]
MSNTTNVTNPTDLFRLDGEVALVTGAASGIGKLAAETFASVGASVIVTDRSLAGATATANAIIADGGTAYAVAMDVSDESAIVAAFADVMSKHGPVSVLVNNAGLIEKAPTETLSLAAWQRVIDVNLTGVFVCAREAGAQMLSAGRGSIINISSIWGHVGGPYSGNLSYHATKSAVIGLTRALAVEWGPRGIRVNDIAPTFLKTEMTAPLFDDDDMHGELVRMTPLGRLGVPSDLAGALLFLASPASSLVTGLSLRVDGGWVAR